MPQTTISRTTAFTGVGLHSGKDVQLKLQPAAPDTGIVFYRHTAQGIRPIKPCPEAVSATALATTLSDGTASVSTVEHVLAALAAMGVDNVQVHAIGAEMPIMDGSAAPMVDIIRRAGIRKQGQSRTVARLKREFSMASEGKVIHARPHHGFYVDYTIDFKHPSIGRQHYALEITPESFADIASARTFGFLHEVEQLHQRGLALGGSLKNAVVLDEQGVVNPDGLRFDDEFVRHKMLDFVGDMAMLGMPLQGAFEVHCSGHHLNNLFLRNLVRQADEYLEIVCEGESQPFWSVCSVKPERLDVGGYGGSLGVMPAV